MLLSRKEVFKNDKLNNTILRHMGYSAYKLWNVGNYEKRNYHELGFEKFPDWYDQKKRLKDNFFYKNLPSQTAQDVLQLLQEGWKSYFKLKETGGVENPNPPRFKHDVMDITFLKDAIKQLKGCIRLTISNQLKCYLKTQGIYADFVYLKTRRFSNVHIKEIQIKFLDEKTYAAIVVYEIADKPLFPQNGRYLSIDLGISNTFACYDSAGTGFIITGFLNATHYYDKKIAYFQSIADSQQSAKGVKYPKKSARILRLYHKKANHVYDFLHKATAYIADYCDKNDIRLVVIGDIKGIREDKNIGRSNQQLHSLPYNRIYELLEYKLSLRGIAMEKQKEAYSSQCPPTSLMVSKRYACKANRKHRGLYITDSAIYNADMVGAYNILRLYLKKKEAAPIPFGNLSSPVKVAV